MSETKKSSAPKIDLAQVEQDLLRESVHRSAILCYALSGLFLFFSATIFPTIHAFDPTIPFIKNFLLRVLLNALPWFLLGYFLRNGKTSNNRKLFCFSFFQGVIFNLSGLIYIWPIALAGQPEIMYGVAGANTQYILSIIAVTAPPTKFLAPFVSICVATIFPSLLFVLSKIHHELVQATIIGDTALSFTAGALFSLVLAKTYYQFASLKSGQQLEAAHYLGKDLHAAIFEDKKDLLEEKLAEGFVLSLDIRDSSKLTRENGERWTKFLKEWMALAPGIIEQKNGKLLKTAGDSLLATFGVFEEDVDLSDIPGLEREIATADERRWSFLTRNTMACSEELIQSFQELAASHFPEKEVRIGVGIDRGKVWKGVRGSEVRKELDIWGDAVNCASRLEAYSKALISRFNRDSSLLVMSPYAADYFNQFEGFTRVDTRSEIKDFAGIKWVLVREFRALRTSSLESDSEAA